MTEDRSQETQITRTSLRLLFIEDNDADYRLALHTLGKVDLEVDADLVSTQEEFIEQLTATPYDVIVADYRLDGWTAMDALHVSHQLEKDIPFILLTGALGDDSALECIKRGVWDYVLKDHLSRLPLAIFRAVEEKHLRDERRRAEAVLRESEAKFRTLADAIAAAIFIYEGFECRYANHAAQQIMGYEQQELLSKYLFELLHKDSTEIAADVLFSLLSDDSETIRSEIKTVRKDGAVRYLDVTMGSIKFEGRPARLLTAIDITERKQMEEEIRRLALSDPLTGLANYRRLVSMIAAEVNRSLRTGKPFSLILFDLDGLKKINDSHGHLTGSRAICRVAEVLQARSRSVDTPARFGGDEFALLMPETRSEEAEVVAQRISDQIRSDGNEPPLSVSFGIAEFPENGTTVEDVFRWADQGLYKMKSA